MRRLNKAGDTIVEVLISMAVIGMILGIAYSTATRSLRTGRQAQERTEALKLIESQLERLKLQADSVDPAAPNVFRTAPFCMTSTSGVVDDTDAQCKNLGPAGIYTISITFTRSTDGDTEKDFFTAKAIWQRQGGGVDEQTEIKYKTQEL